MLVWSTQFPVLPNRSIEDLLTLSAKWLTGSPHTIWTVEDLPEAMEGSIQIREKEGQAVKVARIDAGDASYAGFRHEWTDRERRCWTTEICGRHTPTQFLVGVHLDCATEAGWVDRPRPKKPYIVRQLLAELGGDLDGDFQVDVKYRRLDEAELDVARRVILGETQNRLPIVYFSSTWRNTLVFDDRKLLTLAQELGGMAHVVVEPSRRFSFLLANETSRRNPYEGVIAVFWPASGGRSSRIFPGSEAGISRLFDDIVDTVRDALATTRPDYSTTWDYLRALAVRRRIQTLQTQGREKYDEFVEAFDEELELKARELSAAKSEIEWLKHELARKERENIDRANGLLNPGKERELYEGELRHVLALAFKRAMATVQPDGRVMEVLKSLVEANPPGEAVDRLEDDLKRILHGDSNLGPTERRSLERLGFAITDDGKHLKLVFRNDDRYTFAMPKTGSDWRGLKNAASDITKRLFR